jgi:multidrug resistance efflux pump
MRTRILLLAIVVIAVAAGSYYYFYVLHGQPPAGILPAVEGAQQGSANNLAAVVTTTIRPASELAQINAAGNVDLADVQQVVLQVPGTVVTVPVRAGDVVKPGDLLLALDTTDLERSVQQAEASVAASQAALDKLTQPPLPADLSAAKADLAAAQEALTQLQAGQTQDQLTVLATTMLKDQVAVAQAQTAYDKVAWRNDVGTTTEAATLQQATLDLQNATAAYRQAIAPPTASDVAAAKAKIVDAQDKVAQLLAGGTDADRRAAEANLKQAQLTLEQAQLDLARATVRSPIDAAVLAVNAQVGQSVSSGFSAFSLGDLNSLEATVNVAEVDIPRVKVGQRAQIALDALPGQSFSGVVTRIAASSTSAQGVVNYPVTIQLIAQVTPTNQLTSTTQVTRTRRITATTTTASGGGILAAPIAPPADLSQVRSGMTAVATIAANAGITGWLVPNNALQQRPGGGTYVLVVRNGQEVPVNVTVGIVQGEFTAVQSPDLHAGDAVVGGVTSRLNQQNQPGGGFQQFRNLSPAGPGGGGRRD